MSKTITISVDTSFLIGLVIVIILISCIVVVISKYKNRLKYEEFNGISYDSYDWREEPKVLDYPFHQKQSPLNQPVQMNLFHRLQGINGQLHSYSQPQPIFNNFVGFPQPAFTHGQGAFVGPPYAMQSQPYNYPAEVQHMNPSYPMGAPLYDIHAQTTPVRNTMESPYARFNDSSQSNLIRQRPMS
jgi:hypothetical protein